MIENSEIKVCCIRNIQLNSLKCYCTQLINQFDQFVHELMNLVYPNMVVLKNKIKHHNRFSHQLELESVKLTPIFLCWLFHPEQDEAAAFPSTTCK